MKNIICKYFGRFLLVFAIQCDIIVLGEHKLRRIP